MALQPGSETSEYRLAKWLAVTGTILPSLSFIILHFVPGLQTAAAIASISSGLLAAASVLGYQYSRTTLKEADIAAQAQVAKQALISGIVPPVAQPLASEAMDTLASMIAKKL